MEDWSCGEGPWAGNIVREGPWAGKILFGWFFGELIVCFVGISLRGGMWHYLWTEGLTIFNMKKSNRVSRGSSKL